MKYRLSEICGFVKEKISVAEITNANYISTENMLPNRGEITIASSLPEIENTRHYKPNDVLVSNIRPYFKKIWYATEEGGCSNDVLVFRAKKGIDPDYLYYVLSDDAFFNYSNATSKGTKMPRGDKVAIMNYEIEVKAYDEQVKIASILKGMDKKIEINNAINNNLQQQSIALYQNTFPYSIDDKLPDGWRIASVGEIIELHDSKRIPLSGGERDKMQKIYPYYGATSLMDYVDDFIFDGIYLLLGEDGTVIDAKGYPILQYVWDKFWVNNHAHIITGKLGFSVESLWVLFNLTSVRSIVTGAVQPKISQANLRSIRIVLPPQELLKAYDDCIQPMFSSIRNNHSENLRLSSIRDTLLPKLMSGEIDVSDVEI